MPIFTNHSLYVMKLVSSRYPVGKLRRESAVTWFGESFASTPKCKERFPRRYRNEPSPEFSLTLPCSSMIHLLSGGSSYHHRRTIYPTGNRHHNHQNEHHSMCCDVLCVLRAVCGVCACVCVCACGRRGEERRGNAGVIKKNTEQKG